MKCLVCCRRNSTDSAQQCRHCLMAIPVIDLFAGPGGLGEGFSSVLGRDRIPVFRIKLSIEKDRHAHQTLLLRAFFRQFAKSARPNEYYRYLAGETGAARLFNTYPQQSKAAASEAWHAELGASDITNDAVDKRISAATGQERQWVLLGGPPCQAYSLVGRSRLIGTGEDWRRIKDPARARAAKRSEERR